VMGVTVGLMQGRIGVFAEWMQRRHLYVLRYLASVFSNLASILIVTLSLLGYNNEYQVTVAMTHNRGCCIDGGGYYIGETRL
jgi:hypothetical protein